MPDKNACSILIAGVGGQGILLAGRVIGNLAARRGYDVKVSEVHGMAQRGGSVVTFVRYSDVVASPLIEPGGADIMISFELLEAARWIGYLKPSGNAAVNSQRIDPMPVITGSVRYPEGLEDDIRESCGGAAIIDALALATKCGSARSVNFVLLGAASAFMGFSRDEWISCIRAVTPPKAFDVNVAAFQAGARTVVL